MSVKIGSARIDENGNAMGGKAGGRAGRRAVHARQCLEGGHPHAL